MAMTIMNDASAMMTLGELNKNISALGKQLKKVSSGQRINGAGDAASEYSISEKMRVRIRALDQDERNVQNGAALLRTAEGAVQQQIEIMKTIKEKVIDADNDTNTDIDRATIQKEIDHGYEQLQNIAWETTYNGKLLLVGDTQIEEVYTWKVLDEPITIEDSVMNIIPDDYDSLDGIPGPFAAFEPFLSTESTAEPLLGSNSSVNFIGGADAYYDPPTEATRATFTMDLSGYSSASALNGVGFTSGGRYYVLTNDTTKNYRSSNGTTATKISISGLSTAAEVASKIANTGLSGVYSATASGSTITFTTTGRGTSANTATPPMVGWSAESTDVAGTIPGSPAKRGRDSAVVTGIGNDYKVGTNAQTHSETYLIHEAYLDDNDVYHPAEYGSRTITDASATAASMTKNVASVPSNSGITVNGACIRFVEGTAGMTRQADGTYTVGKNATVNNYSLNTWNNTIGSNGSSTGVTFSLSGGEMTLKTTGTGTGAYISLADGITRVEPQAAVPSMPTSTHYETVTALGDVVSNATGAVDPGPYHPAVSATYDINLTAYDTTGTEKLDEFIGKILGKVLSIKSGSSTYYAYEFTDSTVPTSMDALQQTSASATVDLSALRTAVEGGATIADAFINLMRNKNPSRFSNGSAGSDKILTVTAVSAGKAGESNTINISTGRLSQYTVKFGEFFQGAGSGLNIPEDLQDKGFRIYCATCDDQWFNFQFSLGGELDATRPASGSSGADLKTTIINVSGVTDVESLIQAFYDQARPAMETIKDGHSHTLHVAANPQAGTVTFYDHRMYDPRDYPSMHPKAKEKGAKIADGVMDDVVKMTRGVYVKDLVIQHTDHASQNIHVKIPQTTLDHLFNYIEGAGSISDYNVMTTQSRELLLGNVKGIRRTGGVASQEEKGALDTALDYLTSANTLIGAQIMRLGMTENNIVTARESTTASESTIRDADMAKEMTDYTKANVLAQSAQAMLAQANQSSSGVLSLLQ